MKTVFKAKMNIVLTDQIDESFLSEMKFASANGINGIVSVKVNSIEGNQISGTVEIRTDRKRLFSEFEDYLNLIKTVISNATNLQCGLYSIQDVSMRIISDLSFHSSYGDLEIHKDMDESFYIVNRNQHPAQQLVNHFDTIEDLERYLRLKK